VKEDKTAVLDGFPVYLDSMSLHFRSLTDPAAAVLEQSFSEGASCTKSLLKPNTPVLLEPWNNAGGRSLDGAFVSHIDGEHKILLSLKDREEFVVAHEAAYDIKFRDPFFKLLPSVNWKLDTQNIGNHRVELVYGASAGLKWEARYTVVLGTEDHVQVSGKWSIDNTSGKHFENSAVTFVASQRVDEPSAQDVLSPKKSVTKLFKKKSVLSPIYWDKEVRYHLPYPVTISDKQTKQFKMFDINLQAKRVNLYCATPFTSYNGFKPTASSQACLTPEVYSVIRFHNSQEKGVGIRLPEGRVDVYARSQKGGPFLDYAFQSHLYPTEPGEDAMLIVGNLPLVKGNRSILDFKYDSKRHTITETVRLEVKNEDDSLDAQPVSVVVEEVMFRWESWSLSNVNPPVTHEDDENKASWEITVEPASRIVITYQVTYDKVPHP